MNDAQYATSVAANLLDRANARAARRLLPLLVVCYFVAFIDRVNVGFAAHAMSRDLHFSPAVYGFGAGVFFMGYSLLGVPSNLGLHRIGARRWIALIMAAWGMLSGLSAFVWNDYSFYTARFLLGAAEAGFFPGIILYLTYWFPASFRAKVTGAFMVAIPISSAIGAPLSGVILSTLNGVGGIPAWRWLFILEALPALLLSVAVYRTLTDRPEGARWMPEDERRELASSLNRERAQRVEMPSATLSQAFAHPKILLFCAIYFGLSAGLYGIGLWLPQVVQDFGLTTLQTGLTVAVPYLVSAIAMIAWCWRPYSERTLAARVIIPAIVAALGFIWAGYANSPLAAMIALTIAALGIYAAVPSFWSLPTRVLTGTAVAGGIAFINALGGLGGFAGPYIVGLIKNLTGQFQLAFVALAMLVGAAGVLVFAVQTRGSQPEW